MRALLHGRFLSFTAEMFPLGRSKAVKVERKKMRLSRKRDASVNPIVIKWSNFDFLFFLSFCAFRRRDPADDLLIDRWIDATEIFLDVCCEHLPRSRSIRCSMAHRPISSTVDGNLKSGRRRNKAADSYCAPLDDTLHIVSPNSPK